jgi:dTDP-4-dehydrorhamnose reductase
VKILILGSNGQLGRCLKDQFERKNLSPVFSSRDDVDLSNRNQLSKYLKSISPELIINAAAYTAVDKAEKDFDTANSVNHIGVKLISNFCYKQNCYLVHVSTDFVFNGDTNTLLKEEDPTNPINVYGLTKLMGENAIQSSKCNYLILRTSWVFSEYGNNFFKTMIELSKTRDELKIVSDQLGCPTYAQDIAKSIISIISHENFDLNESGIFHYCGNEICSWYEFACLIFKEAKKRGIVVPSKISKIESSNYSTLATRPSYSGLDCEKIFDKFDIKQSNWRKGVIKSIKEVI